MYDHKNATRFSLEECEKAVGKRATLTFEGVITRAEEGPAGPFVIFKIDERFGFDAALGLDLDALTLNP